MRLKKTILNLIFQITTFQTLENFINLHFTNTPIVIFSPNLGNLTKKLHFLLKLSQPKIITNRNFATKLDTDVTSFIFIENNFDDLTTSFKLQHRNFRTRGRYLVIYQNSNTTEDVLKKTFETLFSYNVYNVVILSNLSFHTWYPYDKDSYCGTRVNLVTNRGNTQSLFQNKLPRTFDNCQFNATWNNYSYAIRTPFDKEQPGYAIRFLNTLAQKLKIKINYMELRKRHRTVKQDAYQKLAEEMTSRNIALAIIAERTRAYFQKEVRMLTPIFLTKQFFVFPPRRPMKNNNKIIEIFSPKVWGIILLSVGIMVLFRKFQTAELLSDNLFYIFQLTCQTVRLPRDKYRWLFLLFVFYVVNLDWFYLTRLSSVLTQPGYEPKLKTLKDLIKYDKKVKFSESTENSLKSFGEEIYHNLLTRRLDDLQNANFRKMLQDFAVEMNHGVPIAETEMAWFKNPKTLQVVSHDEVIFSKLCVRKLHDFCRLILLPWVYVCKIDRHYLK
ncbi:hypothetical protein TcasGA2_TC015624 [Tribolium castaneum]|uniref:Ionotropic glutamate receptor C-terminal domain-containing protein n=1 Tax=Tribolium castaneum TaxID=7070 RepID=D2A602_TRICA|nr:hypothetical protein TcasGA2_TC015624 [Tribolium castaneum]